MTPRNNIAEALKTIRSGAVKRMWSIPSESQPELNHTVSENPLHCTCIYFQQFFAETKRPCRHLWSGPGAQVATFIEAIWNSANQDELARAVEQFADVMKAQDEVFLVVARRIYNDKKDVLQFPSLDKPLEPMAKTMSTLVTPRQLVAIRAIANSHRLDAQEICLEQFNCKYEELSRKAASWLMDFMKAQSEIDLKIAQDIPA